MVRLPGPLDLTGLHDIADLDRAELKYPAFVPSTHSQLAEVETASPVDVFKAVRRSDVLLHHPYDSFSTSVQRFIEQAADDPHVLAIKQTLYRTSGDSPIIQALIDAAEAGKQVLVLVELKARFDEQANIRWARKLEHAGCHVVYGQVGLKTHCKLAMVVRDEPEGIRRYVHIGTGNYNPKTARMYEDYGLLTAHESIGEDVAHLFNNLSGFSRNASYEHLMVAPDGVREGLLEKIRTEIEHQAAGRPARIRIKANSIVDEAVIDELYRASIAGVPVDLLTRGICSVRPEVSRPVGQHPGPVDPRAVPRAQPGVLVRERRLPVGVDRVGRPHAPQPRPPGRVPRGPARPGPDRRGEPAAGPRLRRRHVVLVAELLRRVGPAPPRRGRQPPARAAGEPHRDEPPPSDHPAGRDVGRLALTPPPGSPGRGDRVSRSRRAPARTTGRRARRRPGGWVRW